DLSPPHIVSSVSSLQNFGGNLGASFAPLVTGLLYSSFHNFKTSLIITGVVALVGAVAYIFLMGKVEPTYRKQGQAFQPHPSVQG
ncbi:MAG: MFS transporter, partial [Alicyclobacillus sp.]|nr:MFS transporter [Alicyclobacillus sp.]